MIVRYSRWAGGAEDAERLLDRLVRLFTYLLTKTDGDVREALEWMEMLDREHGFFSRELTMEDFIGALEREGLIRREQEGWDLTAKGARRMRQDAFDEIFSSLKKGTFGAHETPRTGQGTERQSETKKFRFGDTPADIDLTRTLTNSFIRGGIENFTLAEEDIEVHETEHQSTCATVLMLDVSHSMILYGEDRITPAKRVALALSEYIMTRHPRDRLSLVLFGDDAREVSLAELPYAGVGPYHTNTREGLRLARTLLRKSGAVNRQIFMVTDGKPSAMFESSGRLYKNSFGLDPRIVNKTLDEAAFCRRDRISITTFMVARDPMLVEFVDRLTRANQGRAYYTGLGNLGEYVFIDYIRNRRKIVR